MNSIQLAPTVREALDAKAKPKVNTDTVEFLTEVDDRNKRTLATVMLLRNLRGIPLYKGTVPAHVKAKRRERGKVAKASRKLNRGS